MKRNFAISVRELVEFVLRRGDLRAAGESFRGRDRALLGTRAHQRLQRLRPASYRSEVPVSAVFERDKFILKVRGRIDGLQVEQNGVLVEEIKSVRRRWEGEAEWLHLAQGKFYAAMVAREQELARVKVRVTYTEIESGESVEIEHEFTRAELEEFFAQVTEEYLGWIGEQVDWCEIRDESSKQAGFPFGEFRPGQRKLAVAAYRTLAGHARLFAEAPTGIGKTISVLFPAVKALGEGKIEKIFYLTAKTIGRTVAEKGCDDLRKAGQRLRSITLTARDKICFESGGRCQSRECPWARGYFDRLKPALRECLGVEGLRREQIEEIARKHLVCPFELSLDAAVWADLVIGDYNYLFDPSARLMRFFEEPPRDYGILIDEAHNLGDRAREMFSAELTAGELESAREEIKRRAPACGRALRKLANFILELAECEGWLKRGEVWVRRTAPLELAEPVEKVLVALEKWLVEEETELIANEGRVVILECYFRLLSFKRTLEGFDSSYAAVFESGRVELLCLDPALELRRSLEGLGGAVFFSATLSPLEFFRATLGGTDEDTMLRLTSPFPRENLAVLVNRKVATTWKARGHSHTAVAASIGALVQSREGNYLVYFPSFEYLQQTYQRFVAAFPEVNTLVQESGMTETAREEYLRSFEAGRGVVGFAVMGGIFGEGIDLIGDRLIGVVVVGVGLPQLNVKRELMRELYQEQGRDGFAFAYVYPGMNRVLQAVGRLIRSEQDRGAALLIDQRFDSAAYHLLFPEWWQPTMLTLPEQIANETARFWNR